MKIRKTSRQGLEDVVAAETELSFIDGEAGCLIIHGSTLEELSSRDFESVYLELFPGGSPLGSLRGAFWDELKPVLPLLAKRRPVEALRLVLSALPNRVTAEELVAAFPMLLAAAHRGDGLLPPDPSLAHAEDCARMFFGAPVERKVWRALNTYFVTVCEHGMNASTFAARVVASTGATPVEAALAALSALSGPLHGGAPGPVLDMLDRLKGVSDIKGELLTHLQAGNRLMGFGHRVYRAKDPRADVLRQAVAGLSHSDSLQFAEEVERSALEALVVYKPGRALRTNVEFYTAVLLNELGFAREWFTPLFATGRILGWMAHYKEQQRTGRLIRPSSVYIGRMPSPQQ